MHYKTSEFFLFNVFYPSTIIMIWMSCWNYCLMATCHQFNASLYSALFPFSLRIFATMRLIPLGYLKTTQRGESSTCAYHRPPTCCKLRGESTNQYAQHSLYKCTTQSSADSSTSMPLQRPVRSGIALTVLGTTLTSRQQSGNVVGDSNGNGFLTEKARLTGKYCVFRRMWWTLCWKRPSDLTTWASLKTVVTIPDSSSPLPTVFWIGSSLHHFHLTPIALQWLRLSSSTSGLK